jgi:hypothetical protein
MVREVVNGGDKKQKRGRVWRVGEICKNRKIKRFTGFLGFVRKKGARGFVQRVSCGGEEVSRVVVIVVEKVVV